MAAAMSAGRATRPQRRVGRVASARPFSPRYPDTRGVHTMPGATALTRIPSGPELHRGRRTRAISPALAAP